MGTFPTTKCIAIYILELSYYVTNAPSTSNKHTTEFLLSVAVISDSSWPKAVVMLEGRGLGSATGMGSRGQLGSAWPYSGTWSNDNNPLVRTMKRYMLTTLAPGPDVIS